ncbi:MAG: efflux RND transporter permease subunit [Alphaproteobacteria bacterium]|nr:efflux RND transporter permease subunit [Alphaproteobacteria bacterium]
MPQGALASLFAGVVSRPVAVTMAFLAAFVFGAVGYQRLPVELMPDISYPTITVRTAFEGAAPQEVESQISQPIEEALATLDGLVTLESRSRAGNADVVLGFDWNTDMDAASQSIREALQTTFLPDEADRPLILRYDPSLEPFLRLALSYDPDVLDLSPDAALFLLRELADEEIKRRLEGMKGVAAVRVRGGLEREIRVEVREDWLAARGLTLPDVRQALVAENINLAGGSVLEGDTEYLVRTLNEYSGLDELADLEIRRSDGVLVPITDVAVLRETHKERDVVAHLDGAEAVELEVFKEADANVVDVAAQVKLALDGVPAQVDAETVAKMEPGKAKDAAEEALEAGKGLVDRLPDGVRLAVLDDQAEFIELAIDNLRSAVLLGGLFAVFVLYLFLRDFRATGIIGVAIPVSVVVGFAPLYMGGVSLNLMSLGGLALGVGMLVDNAVVVLESIQRYVDDGRPRAEAAVRGVTDVAAAVVASTLTTVAVFAPIGFVEGVGGELFGDLSLAVVGSLMASLVVALFLVPTMAAREPRQVDADDAAAVGRLRRDEVLAEVRTQRDAGLAWCREKGWRRPLMAYVWLRFVVHAVAALCLALARVVWAWTWRVGRFVFAIAVLPVVFLLQLFARGFQAAYGVFAAAYRAAMVPTLAAPWTAVGVAVVLAVGAWFLGGTLGAQLLPEVHQGRFTVDAAMPVGTPLERTAQVVADAERILDATPGVAAVYTTIGTDGRADSRADEGEHSARIRVQLVEGGDVAAREEAVMADVRGRLAALPELTIQLGTPALFSFRTPLEVVIFGRDLDRLRRVGDGVRAAMATLPGLADVRSSMTRGNPEVQIAYDRERLARFGLDTATVAERVRDLVQGVRATEIHRGDQRLELRVQLLEDQRGSLDDLRRLNVNPQVTPPIPLDAVATFTEAIGPSEIRRVDQQRAVVVSANLAGFDMSSAVDDLQGLMRSWPLDDTMSWELGGQARELSGAATSLVFALALAVFLVYVIMASTFENLLHPFVILVSVPLAFVGVVGGLFVWGLPVSVVAAIGVIVLAGVVVNNAIVLVDAINQLRSEGVERLEAIRTAAATRLRPILITTATTVLGLLPLAFGFGAGAEVQKPLAVTVIGGLSCSTLLTLVVIPAVYAIVTSGADRSTQRDHEGAVGGLAVDPPAEPGT